MSTEKLQQELIQVAAVAVAIVQDLRYETTDPLVGIGDGLWSGLNRTDVVLMMVEKERWAQERKWGPQHHHSTDWLAILMEEVGEAAEEVYDPAGADPELFSARTFLWTEVVKLGHNAQAYLKRRFGQ